MSALVPYRASDAKIVQFAADGVAADVRVQPAQRRSGASVYALRLASSEADVTGRLIGVLPSGDAVELGALAVAPGAIGSARVTVAPPRASRFEAVYLEIRSASVLLRVEAPKPPAPRRVRPLAVGTALVALGAVSLGGGSLALAVPQTPMLGAPEHAVAGSRVRVPYATHGYGTLAYAARSDDGVEFASGELRAPRGEIALTLPASAARHRVSLALSLRGPLGGAVGEAAFAVAPPPVAADTGARVLSFAARRDASPYGESVLVSYLALGERGTVVLTDARGTVVATAPFARVGTTRLPVAARYRTQTLTAKIGVDRGTTHAVASVVIPPAFAAAETPVRHDAVPPQADPDAPEGVTPVERSAAATGGGIIAVDGDAIASGTLALRVMAHDTPMQLALQDATGQTLAQREIPAGATRAAIALPPAPQALFLVLRYTRNGGEETIVRSVRTIASRAGQTSSR